MYFLTQDKIYNILICILYAVFLYLYLYTNPRTSLFRPITAHSSQLIFIIYFIYISSCVAPVFHGIRDKFLFFLVKSNWHLLRVLHSFKWTHAWLVLFAMRKFVLCLCNSETRFCSTVILAFTWPKWDLKLQWNFMFTWNVLYGCCADYVRTFQTCAIVSNKIRNEFHFCWNHVNISED